jgi:hypothetical protein
MGDPPHRESQASLSDSASSFVMIPSEANDADARTDQHARGRIQADQQTLRLDITADRGYFRPKFRQCYRDPA